MNIGVFFGSKSPEHDVSIITGTFICNSLIHAGYNVVPVYISQDLSWYIGDELKNIEFFQKNYTQLNKYKGYKINIEKSKGVLILEKEKIFSKQSIEIDLVFPAFHGSYGEDGTFQGLCEFFNVPYVGCDVLQSAIAIDKVTTKLLYQRFNFPTTKFTYFNLDEWIEDSNKILEDISANLIFPVFVKPARLGSSIGIAKSKNLEELRQNIEVALQYDTKILVEESVENLYDLTVCVKGTISNPVVSEIQHSMYTQDFFSYEDKYIKSGGSQTGRNQKNIIIPANIDSDIYKEIQTIAIQIFKKFECNGIARIDFLFDTLYQKFYVNEINTLPGTFYHHLWRKSGFDFENVLGELIDISIAKHKTKNNLVYNFKSNILQSSQINKFSNKYFEGTDMQSENESISLEEENFSKSLQTQAENQNNLDTVENQQDKDNKNK